MAAALNPKMLLPVLAFVADAPTKRLPLRLPKLDSGLVLADSDSIPEVAVTGASTTGDPNLKIGADAAEVERPVLLVMDAAKALVVVVLLPLLPVEVRVKVELFDEFWMGTLLKRRCGMVEGKDGVEERDPLLKIELLAVALTPILAVGVDVDAADENAVSGVLKVNPAFELFLLSAFSNSGTLGIDSVAPATKVEKLQIKRIQI